MSAYPEDARCYLTARDVTEEEQAHQQARESDARYQNLFRCTPLPLGVIDRQTGAFLAVNEAAVDHYDYPREEFLAMTFADLLSPEERTSLPTPLTPQALSQRWHHRTCAGRSLQVDVRAHQVDFQGRDAVVVVVYDVTARLEAEAQLLQAQRLESVGRLASGVAHDFNNLLTVIGSVASMVAEDLPADAPTRAMMQEILEAQGRGADLTRQLLTFSRQNPSRPVAIDLSRALYHLHQLLGRLLGSSVALTITAPPEPLWIFLAPVLLEQVVINLAVNARDAMPTGGRFTLQARQARDTPEAILTIHDTGQGIPPDVIGHIFEPFFTTKPPEIGTGLGLATTYGIITGAGGTIAVSSPPEQGTTFTIRLPLYAPPP